MCSPALCETCNKVTWAGCGQHIEEALEGVPEEQLCKCEANQLETPCVPSLNTFQLHISALFLASLLCALRGIR